MMCGIPMGATTQMHNGGLLQVNQSVNGNNTWLQLTPMQQGGVSDGGGFQQQSINMGTNAGMTNVMGNGMMVGEGPSCGNMAGAMSGATTAVAFTNFGGNMMTMNQNQTTMLAGRRPMNKYNQLCMPTGNRPMKSIDIVLCAHHVS